jgi:hypothetical protein
MRRTGMSARRRRVTALLVAALAARLAAAPVRAAEDPLAAEIARWSAFLHDNDATDQTWQQVKAACGPPLARAAAALAQGRRLLALQKLAAVRANLAAARWLRQRPAEARLDEAAFEAEWRRAGERLKAELGTPSADAFAAVQPAALRALAEAALPQVHAYYQASLEYGRNTMPESGLFYISSAEAASEFAGVSRALAEPSRLRLPALRPLAAELDALESELLAAYRPPASLDRHPEFIAASSTLNEARSLDGASLRFGALLRYLQAAQRVALLREAAAAPRGGELSARLQAIESRLASDGVDHSIARLLIETAQDDLDTDGPARGAVAAAIADDVLARYLAALEPAPTRPPRPEPRVSVTLVRWPYT